MNGTLKREAEWRQADALIRASGLPPYARGPVKTWDALRARDVMLANVSKSHPILDVGGLPNFSWLSHWLAHAGYRIDVVNKALPDDFHALDGAIHYRRGDATRLPDPDACFGGVTCLSVIEHGVDLDRFFPEMHRILARSGILVISTDFWCEPIGAGVRAAFGAPVRIFTPPEIQAIVDKALGYGFEMTGPIDDRCEDAPVHWLGLQYTFIDFALRKAG